MSQSQRLADPLAETKKKRRNSTRKSSGLWKRSSLAFRWSRRNPQHLLTRLRLSNLRHVLAFNDTATTLRHVSSALKFTFSSRLGLPLFHHLLNTTNHSILKPRRLSSFFPPLMITRACASTHPYHTPTYLTPSPRLKKSIYACSSLSFLFSLAPLVCSFQQKRSRAASTHPHTHPPPWDTHPPAKTRTADWRDIAFPCHTMHVARTLTPARQT